MIRAPISKKLEMSSAIFAIILLIVAYSFMCIRQKQMNSKDRTIPNASQFIDGAKTIIQEGWLWDDLRATYTRYALGMSVGVIMSVVVGMAMGCFPVVKSFFILPISFLAKIPPTAMLALYFCLCGTDMMLFVAMIAFGIFPTLTQAIQEAACSDVGDNFIYKAYTLGASTMEVIYNIVFQQILPRVIENIRLMAGPAMIFLIAAEWAVGGDGFGYRLKIQSRLSSMNIVYIYLVLLGAIGFILDWTLLAFRRYWCPWFGGE